ncbi:MAG: toll/interleukin-1 receptor domain-containing protein [Thiobacillaceae bacterium]
MSAIFLSYRRDDSAGFAGRLADELEAQLGAGSVFRDVDDIRPGENFVAAINSQLNEVQAVLIMIGPHWLTAASNGQRRLDKADDFVRQEIQAALAFGKPVIPLLVGGAAMPAEADLPPEIAGLARRQAVVLSDVDWKADVERLVHSLRPELGSVAGAGRPWRRILLGLSGTGLVLFLAVLLLRHKIHVPAPADVSGRWTAQVKYDWGDEYTERFEFKYLGKALHGTATYQQAPLAIEHAKLEGEWLSFVTRSQEMLGSDTPWKGSPRATLVRSRQKAFTSPLKSAGAIPSIRRSNLWRAAQPGERNGADSNGYAGISPPIAAPMVGSNT